VTLRYDHLLGLPFRHGSVDCYGLCRRFYHDNFGLELANYARPDDWWKTGLDLYMENFRKEGFKAIDVHPRETAIGDGFLIALRSEKANHAAIYIGDGKIIHHVWGRMSNVERYDGIWQKCTVAHLRHPTVFAAIEAEAPKVMTTIDLMGLLPPHMKRLLNGEVQAPDR